jgi:hypothetical protein
LGREDMEDAIHATDCPPRRSELRPPLGADLEEVASNLLVVLHRYPDAELSVPEIVRRVKLRLRLEGQLRTAADGGPDTASQK